MRQRVARPAFAMILCSVFVIRFLTCCVVLLHDLLGAGAGVRYAMSPLSAPRRFSMPEVDPTHASACSQARIRYDLVLGFRHQIFVLLCGACACAGSQVRGCSHSVTRARQRRQFPFLVVPGAQGPPDMRVCACVCVCESVGVGHEF